MVLRHIPIPTLGRSLTNEASVTTHVLQLVIRRNIPSPTLGRSLTNVATVTTHALQRVNWNATWRFTKERTHPHNHLLRPRIKSCFGELIVLTSIFTQQITDLSYFVSWVWVVEFIVDEQYKHFFSILRNFAHIFDIKKLQWISL